MSSTQDSEVATTANGYYSNEELLEGIDSEILLDVASQWYGYSISLSLWHPYKDHPSLMLQSSLYQPL